MNLQGLIAVSGFPGIYRAAGNKPNGLIIEDLKDGKRQFVSARTSNFTPLESIFIYVTNQDEESIPLKEVFRSMLSQADTVAVPTTKSPDADFKAYLKTVLPNYDRDRVYVSDMKKLIKWYTFLKDLNLLSIEDESTTVTEEPVPAVEVVEEAPKEEKPKKKTTKKKED
jgi:Domain of unknown function (DUF5606)